MLLIRFLCFIILIQSCQHLHKEELSQEQIQSAKLITQFKIVSPQHNKSLSAKSVWYIQKPLLLRIDILGPFDLLMAQIYRHEKQLTIIDHRKKTVTYLNAQKPILIDQNELPLAELSSLLIEPKPKNWSCPSNQSNQQCQKGDLTSSWPTNNQLKLLHPKFDLTLTIKQKIENPTFDSQIFKLTIPSSYQVTP